MAGADDQRPSFRRRSVHHSCTPPPAKTAALRRARTLFWNFGQAVRPGRLQCRHLGACGGGALADHGVLKPAACTAHCFRRCSVEEVGDPRCRTLNTPCRAETAHAGFRASGATALPTLPSSDAPACACVMAMPSASAASLPGAARNDNNRVTIACTCVLASRGRWPTMAFFICSAVYSETAERARHQRRQRRAARLAEEQRALRVDVDEDDFDGSALRVVALRDFADAVEDDLQPPRQVAAIATAAVLDRAAGDVGADAGPSASMTPKPVVCKPGVDAEDPHRGASQLEVPAHRMKEHRRRETQRRDAVEQADRARHPAALLPHWCTPASRFKCLHDELAEHARRPAAMKATASACPALNGVIQYSAAPNQAATKAPMSHERATRSCG